VEDDANVTVKRGGDAGIMFRVSEPTAALDGDYVGLKTVAGDQDADEPPMSPVTSQEPLKEIELIPIGCACARWRVSDFPVLQTTR
jgi:hypothetical protein